MNWHAWRDRDYAARHSFSDIHFENADLNLTEQLKQIYFSPYFEKNYKQIHNYQELQIRKYRNIAAGLVEVYSQPDDYQLFVFFS